MRHVPLKIALPLTWLPVLLLISCQQLGLAPAQSFDQKLAYAYGTHTAIVQAATFAVSSGSIKADEGKAVLDLATQARTLLDSARTLEATDTATAGNKLTLAAAILTQLQSYLAARGVK